MWKHKNLNWKPIETDIYNFNEKMSDCLIGISECMDYNLQLLPPNQVDVNNSKKRKLVKKTKGIGSQKAKKEIYKSHLMPSKAGSTICCKDATKGNVEIIARESIENDFDDVESVALWNNFGLPKSILKALALKNFTQPTEIQALTLPPAIFGRRDILGAAETGSGKTLAFGLPILTGILKLKEACISESNESDKCLKPLYAVILTPTRELAFQIKNHLTDVARFTGIKIATVVGGMAAVKQERILKQGPEIVVATPGRFWELFNESGNEHLSQLNDIKFLVIDETDRMIEKGHFQELYSILEQLNFDKEKCKKRQNFVFSATLTLVHELPKYLATKKKIHHLKRISELTPLQKLQNVIDTLGITDPKIIDLSEGKGTSSTLTECRITCSLEDKDYYLYYFIQRHPGRTLIFCNSIGCVKRVTTILNLLQCHPLPLHAAMQQRQRLKNLDRFTANINSILVATDVAARGLDIPNIEHVIHYQTPRTSESYVHRSGRTARASHQGITVLLMEPSELQNYLKLCRTLGKEKDIAEFPVNDSILNAVRERVNVARELDKLELHLKKSNAEYGWFQKIAGEMDIVVDDNILVKYEKSDGSKLKKKTDVRRKQLISLLMKPLFPKGFSGKYHLNENNVPLTEEFYKQEKAIDVMNAILENTAVKKVNHGPLFKSKRKHDEEPSNLGIPRKKFKNDRKNKKSF